MDTCAWSRVLARVAFLMRSCQRSSSALPVVTPLANPFKMQKFCNSRMSKEAGGYPPGATVLRAYLSTVHERQDQAGRASSPSVLLCESSTVYLP